MAKVKPVKTSLSIEQFLERNPPANEPAPRLPFWVRSNQSEVLYRCHESFYPRWTALRMACWLKKKSAYGCACRAYDEVDKPMLNPPQAAKGEGKAVAASQKQGAAEAKVPLTTRQTPLKLPRGSNRV